MDNQRYAVVMGMNNFVKACIILLTFVTSSKAQDCYYKPCKNTGKKYDCTFAIGCRMEHKLAKCNISGLSTGKVPPLEKGSTCIAPVMVPGFADFCLELLNDYSLSQPAPANVHNDNDKDDTNKDIIQESKLTIDKDSCFGTTILVSVAIGCFLAGCFITWLIMFCCKLTSCCRSRNKEAVLGNGGDVRSSWNTAMHDRPIGSTSSAQLLGNASVESMSTNNTLLSNGDSPPFHDVATLDRTSGAPYSDFQLSLNRLKGKQGGHRRSPSAAWVENRSPLLPNARSQSTQWNLPRQSTLPNISSRTSQWARSDGTALPNSQGASFTWNSQGLPSFTNENSNSAPWLDNIYSPASESSSRDYQSIQGGSENPYAPCSESSSDYSAQHRVMIIRDGEIYQPSSESSGSNNDYTSLKGQRFSRQNETIYYPTSEGSNKDYASLLNDKEPNEATGNECSKIGSVEQMNKEESCEHKSFNVSGLTFPVQASCRSNFGWTSNLEEIHEYETVDSTRKDEGNVNVSNVATIADLCDVNHNTDTSIQPHEYFQLEPVQ